MSVGGSKVLIEKDVGLDGVVWIVIFERFEVCNVVDNEIVEVFV